MIIDTQVCNESLGLLLEGVELSDAENDTSLSAKLCRSFYPVTLEYITRRAPWPKHMEVGALAETENPNPIKWRYAYRQPSDCVRFWRIDNGSPTQTAENQIAYEIRRDSVGPIILTNQPQAYGEWGVAVEDPAQWDADFRMAFIHILASKLAPKLTGGDQFKLGPSNLQLGEQILSMAAAAAMNEQQRQYDRSSGYSRARS